MYLVQLKLSKLWYGNNLGKLRYRLWKKTLKRLTLSDYYKNIIYPGAQIESFPVINKQIFMLNFDHINTEGVGLDEAFQVAMKAEKIREFTPTLRGITVGLSSGTSGNRGVFLATEKERAFWVAAILDRVIGFSFKKRRVAFFLRANSNIYESVKSKSISFEFFDLLDDLASHIKRLNIYKPTILVAQPSMLKELAKAREKNELNINPQKIISVAEVLNPEDRMYFAKVFKQTIHQVYQCTEGFLASTCIHGTLHFNEDFLHIEKKFLDDEKNRFHPIITDLIRSSQPIIRYELNDILIEEKDCPCQSKMLGIKSIEGRSDDVLIFKTLNGNEINIFPDFIRRAIIMSNEKITDFTVIQKGKFQLLLFIEGEGEDLYENASEALFQLLKQHKVQYVAIEQIKDNQHIKGNKLRRVRNEYKKMY